MHIYANTYFCFPPCPPLSLFLINYDHAKQEIMKFWITFINSSSATKNKRHQDSTYSNLLWITFVWFPHANTSPHYFIEWLTLFIRLMTIVDYKQIAFYFIIMRNKCIKGTYDYNYWWKIFEREWMCNHEETYVARLRCLRLSFYLLMHCKNVSFFLFSSLSISRRDIFPLIHANVSFSFFQLLNHLMLTILCEQAIREIRKVNVIRTRSLQLVIIETWHLLTRGEI